VSIRGSVSKKDGDLSARRKKKSPGPDFRQSSQGKKEGSSHGKWGRDLLFNERTSERATMKEEGKKGKRGDPLSNNKKRDIPRSPLSQSPQKGRTTRRFEKKI